MNGKSELPGIIVRVATRYQVHMYTNIRHRHSAQYIHPTPEYREKRNPESHGVLRAFYRANTDANECDGTSGIPLWIGVAGGVQAS